jgi:hypothetical protein
LTGHGAPFVGAAAATLAIGEIIRLLHGGPVHELIDLNLKSPEYRSAVPTRADFSAFNPGYVLKAAGRCAGSATTGTLKAWSKFFRGRSQNVDSLAGACAEGSQ